MGPSSPLPPPPAQPLLSRPTQPPAVTKRPRKMQVMLLETHLDTDLRSDRSESRFLRELFENFGDLDFISSSIHSQADLTKFLDHARGHRRVDVVHIVAHGRAGRHGTTIGLTDGESLDLHRRDVQ